MAEEPAPYLFACQHCRAVHWAGNQPKRCPNPLSPYFDGKSQVTARDSMPRFSTGLLGLPKRPAEIVVKVVPRRGGAPGWQFRCPYCRRTHRHGVGLGERASHCHAPNSPLVNGYTIVAENQEATK